MLREAGMPVTFGPGLWADVVRLTGSGDKAAHFFRELAEETGKPVLWNMPVGGDESKTVAIAPPGWTREKLDGYVAGMHESLSDSFGLARVEPLLNRRERRRRARGRGEG
jgi:hypothetical protein